MPGSISATVLMVSEDQLIERVSRKFPSRDAGLCAGIGDDAAVMRPNGRSEWVITTDAFSGKRTLSAARRLTQGDVGYKALARASSDLAAMGARPRYFLLGSLALRATCTGKWLDEFLNGMALAARRFDLTLVGGDTTRYRSIAINLTVMGRSRSRPSNLRLRRKAEGT